MTTSGLQRSLQHHSCPGCTSSFLSFKDLCLSEAHCIWKASNLKDPQSGRASKLPQKSRQGRGIPLCVLQEAGRSLDAALWRLRALSQPAASDAAVLAGRQLQGRSSMQITPCQDNAGDGSYPNGHLCLPDSTHRPYLPQQKSHLLPVIQVKSVSATWRADLHTPPIPMARQGAHDCADSLTAGLLEEAMSTLEGMST